MGITGLFLVSFIIIHMSGNLPLFLGDVAGFNLYTQFMTTNPLIKVMELVLVLGFGLHIYYALTLTRKNRDARPAQYVFKNETGSSSWFSRNMGFTGSIIFIFLAVHLYMFWGYFHYGSGQPVAVQTAYEEVWKLTEPLKVNDSFSIAKGGYITKDALPALMASGVSEVKGVSMYKVVHDSFKVWWIVLFYVLAMALLAFHLNHGFQSAFRSLGLVHLRYSGLIKAVGTGIAVVVPLLFALMPVYHFFI